MEEILKEHKIYGTFKDIYVVGDIHGELRGLVYDLTERYDIKDAIIVLAGDVGLGFEKPGHYDQVYSRIAKRLDENNLMLLGVRGNHDDPEYFNGGLVRKYPRFQTVPDYTVLVFQNHRFLVIGGAVSVDQEGRVPGKTWWPGEAPLMLTDREIEYRLPGQIDGVISHDAPISFQPVGRRGNYSEEIWWKSQEVRNYLEKILWKCHPKLWYYGHYHDSYVGTNGVCRFSGLDIQEIKRVPLETL